MRPRTPRTARGTFAWVLSGFACLANAGCDSGGFAPSTGPGIAAVRKWLVQSAPEYKLDVLVVVDTSLEGTELRQRLATELPSSLHLPGLPGGMPSLHVGVVPAGIGPPSCSAPPRAPAQRCSLQFPYGYLATDFCGAYHATEATTADLVSCLANAPTDDCDRGDPLDVLAQTLDDPAAMGLSGPQPFFRPDATLVVLLVSAKTSTGTAVRPVEDVVRAMGARSPTRIVVIVATPPTSCGGDDPVVPILGERLDEFAKAWGPRVQSTALCPGAIGMTFGRNFGFSDLGAFMCLDGVKDVDAETAGLQVDCVVEDVMAAGTAANKAVPSCADSAPPCWQLRPDATCRQIPGFFVVREPGFCPQGRMATRVFCTGCTDPSDPACAP